MPHLLFAATVVFSGLILHYETNPVTHQKTAFLVNAAGHSSAQIVVNSGLVDDKGFIDKTGTRGTYKLNTHRRYAIVPSQYGGGVNPTADFDAHVPHLSKLLSAANAAIDPGAIAGRSQHVHSGISYAKGTLDIQNCYEQVIKFYPHDTGEQCLAESVVLTFDTDQWEFREVGNPSNKLVIASNGQVTIYNGAMAPGKHQLYFAKLLDPPDSATVDEYVRQNKKCDTQHCSPTDQAFNAKKHHPEVECSNSQWP
jgi:hypothetical protein